MPGAVVSGNVIIGDKVYMGTNSSIRQKIKVCNDVIIGLNAGVIKNIEESGTYTGTPTKKLK
jgi:UDP-3-O-[3-hydroxymyristoyl] glucosamine N-acyltransferase